jgi:hypothetical protein
MAVIFSAQPEGSLAGLKINTTQVKRALQEIQNRHAKLAKQRATAYPAPRPGSHYKRTNILPLGWRIESSHEAGDSLVASVTNESTRDKRGRFYPKYVYGSVTTGTPQAAVHRGRWPKENELVDKDAYINDCETAVFKALAI